jgi:hypothetical protein
MKSTTFWNITPCSPLKVDRRFGGPYRVISQKTALFITTTVRTSNPTPSVYVPPLMNYQTFKYKRLYVICTSLHQMYSCAPPTSHCAACKYHGTLLLTRTTAWVAFPPDFQGYKRKTNV